MVVFCSKIYCVENKVEIKKSKFSCKGLNKWNFIYLIVLYKWVLKDNFLVGEINCGFWVLNNIVFIYM